MNSITPDQMASRVHENTGCNVIQVVSPCSMPPPYSTDVTSTTPAVAEASSLAASTTTSAAAAAGYCCATTQSPTLLPQGNQTPGATTSTSDMPSTPLPNTDNNTTTGLGSDNQYQLTSPGIPLHPSTGSYNQNTASHPIDTYQLLQQPLPYFTICNTIPNPSPGRIYPPTDSQQILTTPNGPTVLPRYTGVTAIDEILGEEYNERIRRQFPERHMGYGHRLIDRRDSELYRGVGVDGGRVVRAEGVGTVRRWACTGVLLLVGALPWLIAMATFIRQRNTALTGLLGLVFVFFMAVILGRLIRRAREVHWLARQERRRRQHCIHHVCSTPMLMPESPPAYDVVVKSPPPYSISCDSSSRHFPNQHQFNNISSTVPQQVHNSSTTVPQQLQHSSDCGRADSAPSSENLDLRRINVDDRDPHLPSYDEAVGRT